MPAHAFAPTRAPSRADTDLPPEITRAVAAHESGVRPRLDRLWAYYRNPLELVAGAGHASTPAGSWYRQAQELGLPTRIKGRGPAQPGLPAGRGGRREVVIENDIAWRVQTMVDFMLGRPVRFESLGDDPDARARAERVLEQVWERSGGIALMQDAALLGHVFGHVDLLLRVDESRLLSLDTAAEAFTIEPIDPRRGVPVVSPDDYRDLTAYAVHTHRAASEPSTGARRAVARASNKAHAPDQSDRREAVTEVLTPGRRRVYRDGRQVASERAGVLAGVLPVVHIQNVSQPFVYAGIGEVEPLVPLQDELNTRLSDRANRVTLQSFRMYLAKGVESFEAGAIGPGAVWSTNNPDASIDAFGGDLYNPGEEAHIAEVREALDKISAVPPLAGGVVRAKLGNLSSANALRVTLLGLIARTQRKRVSYARGMERVCALILRAIDESGLASFPDGQRAVRVVWPAFAFEDEQAQLNAAKAKRELGVPESRVLAELGHADPDPGVV